MPNELRIQYEFELVHEQVRMFWTAKYIRAHSTNFQKQYEQYTNQYERPGMSRDVSPNEQEWTRMSKLWHSCCIRVAYSWQCERGIKNERLTNITNGHESLQERCKNMPNELRIQYEFECEHEQVRMF